MSTLYPNNIDNDTTLPNPGSGSNTKTPSHIGLHANSNDAIKALETKVGVDSSADTSSHEYKIAQLSATAASQASSIATINGQISSILSTLTGVATLTGTEVLTNKTLTTPTIANFTNAQHDHTNAAGGGQLSTGAYADNSVTYAKLDLSALPRCGVIRSSNQTLSTSTITPVQFDTEYYDVGGLHSTSSNTDRFTAAEAGLYTIFGHATFAANATGRRAIFISVFNSSNVDITPNGDWATLMPNAGASTCAVTCTEDYYLNAGDYLKFGAWQDSGGNLDILGNRVKCFVRKVAE